MHFGYLGFYGRIPKNSGGSKWGNDNINGLFGLREGGGGNRIDLVQN